MKTIYLHRLLFLPVLSLLPVLSCDRELDLDPQQSIEAGTALSTPSGVRNTLFGVYDRLQNPALFGTNYNLLSELFAATTDLSWSGTFTSYRDIFQKNAVATNREAERTWILAYDAINIANNVEAAIGVLEGEPDRDQLLGESHFLRSIVYFELIRGYAQQYEAGSADSEPGVPLMLTPVTTSAQDMMVERSSVQEVYDQIIRDLKSAEDLLQEELPGSGRPNTYVASAFLSRVYLQMGDYRKAASAADRVIEGSGFSMVENIEQAFNNEENTTEDIFAIQQTEQSNAGTSNNGMSTFYASLPGIGRGDMDIEAQHLERYENGDARAELFYKGTGEKPGTLRSAKWTGRYANIPILRLAELYLTRAEANFRLGENLTQVQEDVNRIRERAGLAPIEVTSLDQILKERRLELAFEGDILHTLKRTKQDIGNRPYNDPKLILPIPQREMIANSALVQNEGY